MALPPIVSATLQSSLIAASANILAQAITAHQNNVCHVSLHISYSAQSNLRIDALHNRLDPRVPILPLRRRQHTTQLPLVSHPTTRTLSPSI